jgi:hypothetical protein
MSNSRMLSRLVLAALVAVLIAAPASSAMQAGPHGDAAMMLDARGEAAASGGGTGAAAGTALPSRPTPLPPRAVSIPDGDVGGGVDLPVVLLLIGGALAVCGAMAVGADRLQTRTAH